MSADKISGNMGLLYDSTLDSDKKLKTLYLSFHNECERVSKCHEEDTPECEG